MIEEWREVKDYPGYEISNFGRLRSSRMRTPATILKPSVIRAGYLTYSLRSGATHKRFMAHRLVLEAFVGPCPAGMQCGHLDGNSSNNRVDNLKWITALENQSHRKIHGTYFCGENAVLAKLTDKDVIEIRRDFVTRGLWKDNVTHLADKYGVHKDSIRNAIAGRTWKHLPGARPNEISYYKNKPKLESEGT